MNPLLLFGLLLFFAAFVLLIVATGVLDPGTPRSGVARSLAAMEAIKTPRRGWLIASTAASDRATPLRGVPVLSTPVATMRSTNAAKNSSRPTRSSGLTSHLDLHDPGQPERADAEQDDA